MPILIASLHRRFVLDAAGHRLSSNKENRAMSMVCLIVSLTFRAGNCFKYLPDSDCLLIRMRFLLCLRPRFFCNMLSPFTVKEL